MNAKEFIRAGKLKDARDALTKALKASPADASSRTLLLQVLMFYGEWEKAERHVDVLAAQSSDALQWAAAIKHILQAEKERRKVFGRLDNISFLPEPPPYIEAYRTAVDHVERGDIDAAQTILHQVFEQLPPVAGSANGVPFEGFVDTDTVLTCFIEAFVYERYVWLPIDAIRQVSVSRPEHLLDLLYASAEVVTWEGLNINCRLPIRYPGSSDGTDDQVKMGRMTEWVPLGGPFSKGVGQHVYAAGETDIPILEIEELVFHFPKNTAQVNADG